MTNDDLPPELQKIGLEPEDLDGHTIEQLSDYLDAGQNPPDRTIDDSPGCQIALQAIARLKRLSQTLLESETNAAVAPDDGWVQKILGSIAMDARSGRSIPIYHPAPQAELAITEGAVRGIIRAAEEEVDGVIIGRCRLDGDVTTSGEPITIRVDASIVWGLPIPSASARLRLAIATQLQRHTELNVAGIDITIRDLYQLPEAAETEQP